MGKTTGFLEFKRVLPLAADPGHRVSNWNEFHRSLDDREIEQQAARCMNCGTPFCHVGESHDGVAIGCPVRNVIPTWNDLVYRGRWKEAFATLALTNNFPEFTSRVCPAPCESSCVLGINDDPVAIKEIEYEIIERAFAKGLIFPRVPQRRTGKRVAVIGSGPAGLAAADMLNQSGHNVTVFERDDRIGGLLMYGIPNMKLDKRIVDRRTDLLLEEGVEFRTRVCIGVDISAGDLRTAFDALVLCCGATKPRDLPIEGRNLKGIHFAMDFLTKSTKAVLGDPIEPINVEGQKVVVIGGGDTGTDCIGTAMRQGCRGVVQFEIMDTPPSRAVDHDGWLSNIRTFRADYGQEEAAERFGSDPRVFSLMTKKFVDDGNGSVCGLETVEVEWSNNSFTEIEGSNKFWEADTVFLAMGFVGPEKAAFFEDLGVTLTERGIIAVDEHKATNVEGVFAAGDCERGQSLIVWAIADGRKAAESVNLFLKDG
jgi:glutamate synthase (NADPH/NADH) small chain